MGTGAGPHKGCARGADPPPSPRPVLPPPPPPTLPLSPPFASDGELSCGAHALVLGWGAMPSLDSESHLWSGRGSHLRRGRGMSGAGGGGGGQCDTRWPCTRGALTAVQAPGGFALREQRGTEHWECVALNNAELRESGPRNICLGFRSKGGLEPLFFSFLPPPPPGH